MNQRVNRQRRRRRPRRRRGRNRRPQPSLIIPPSTTLNMKFEATSRALLVSQVPAFIFLSGNNINNVTLTGATASQPTSYLQWQAFYSKFEVLSSRIKVNAVNLNNQESCYMVLFPEITTTTILDLAEAATQKYSKSRILGQGNGIGSTTISHQMSSQQLFGKKRSEVSPFISDYTLSTGPPSQWNWSLGIGNPDTLGTAGIEIMLRITVSYRVRVHSRRVLRNSTLPTLNALTFIPLQNKPLPAIKEEEETKTDNADLDLMIEKLKDEFPQLNIVPKIPLKMETSNTDIFTYNYN